MIAYCMPLVMMRAADLGAAPGGWTWVLTRHGLRVQSIDNGPLRQHVLEKRDFAVNEARARETSGD